MGTYPQRVHFHYNLRLAKVGANVSNTSEIRQGAQALSSLLCSKKRREGKN